MIRPPPRSTLFPYTPLSRSVEAMTMGQRIAVLAAGRLRQVGPPAEVYGQPADVRSEEHTSELQSQSNLVCRLLLEKKKKKRSEFVCSDCNKTYSQGHHYSAS